MGRRKNKKREMREEITDEQRRKFLKIALALGGSAVITTVGSLSYFGASESAPSLANKRGFSFLGVLNKPNEYDIPVDQIETNCVPLERENIVHSDLLKKRILRNADPWIKENLRSANIENDFETKITTSRYGVPSEDQIGIDAENYSKRLLSFLESKIKGLEHGEPEFVRIAVDSDHSEYHNNKIFIGRNNYQVNHVDILMRGEKVFRVTRAYSDAGAFTSFRYENGKNLFTYAFISSNPVVLSGVCSEIIPWTTTKKFREHIEKKGYDYLWKADEALVEGISHLISLEAAQEFKVPDGERILKNREAERRKSDLIGVYSSVEKSIAWLQRNGIQQGFDLYMESPEKFIKAIDAK